VQRRQLDEALELLGNAIVDQRRLAKVGSSVDDAMRGGRNPFRCLGERREPLGRPIRRDERELQARRARVDDENRFATQ
jgi:hypothetical protein